MSKIFISYRRDDSAPTAGRIYDRLIAHFGKDAVFKDVDSIPYGENFPRYIAGVVAECAVMLAIIGPYWVDAATPSGERRLDDPADFVRVEIESALQRGLPVIPVLVQGARIPGREQLPPSLQVLADLNGLAVRNDPDFNGDMYRLQATLERWLPSVLPSQAQGGYPYGKAPARQFPSAGPAQPSPAMPAVAAAPPRALKLRYVIGAGALAGLVPASLLFATSFTLPFGALGLLTSLLTIVGLASGSLAPTIVGFLLARRTRSIRYSLLGGLAAGFGAWLALEVGIVILTVSDSYMMRSTTQSIIANLLVIPIGLALAWVGGLVGSAVSRRQKAAVPTAAGR